MAIAYGPIHYNHGSERRIIMPDEQKKKHSVIIEMEEEIGSDRWAQFGTEEFPSTADAKKEAKKSIKNLEYRYRIVRVMHTFQVERAITTKLV